MASEHVMARYDRQVMIDGFGVEGQERLKRASVAIAGAGGLGCVVAAYMAAAGLGKIRLIDHDRVEASNLNRQILHWEKDLGRLKVESAREKLESMNSEIEVEAVGDTITDDNAFGLVDGCDLIVDAMDNFPARFILNRVAVRRNLPLFHGAVSGFEGRATTIIPGRTPCLACLYHRIPEPGVFPVAGVAPAVIGSIQATEVMKYIVGIGELLTGRLLVYDGLSLKFMETEVKRSHGCPECRHLKEARA